MSNPERRGRRRAVRPSDAPGIDRDVDRPDPRFGGDRSADEAREVILEPEAEEPGTDEDFWREQRPPHYA